MEAVIVSFSRTAMSGKSSPPPAMVAGFSCEFESDQRIRHRPAPVILRSHSAIRALTVVRTRQPLENGVDATQQKFFNA